eukprot:242391-Alexandrium_andersonii.AAC.1
MDPPSDVPGLQLHDELVEALRDCSETLVYLRQKTADARAAAEIETGVGAIMRTLGEWRASVGGSERSLAPACTNSSDTCGSA